MTSIFVVGSLLFANDLLVDFDFFKKIAMRQLKVLVKSIESEKPI